MTVSGLVPRTVRPDPVERRSSGLGLPTLLAAFAAIATYAVVAADVLPGPVLLAVFALLLVAMPTASTFRTRVACNIALVVGWAPAMWWVTWPVSVDHAAVVLAVMVAALSAKVASTTDSSLRWRILVPRMARVDLLIAGTAILSVLVARRWAFPGSDRAALQTLAPSVDNVAHFQMFSTIRAYGARTGALGASPDGSLWTGNPYPQGFHSWAATLAELMHPNVTSGPALLSAYTEATAVAVVLAMTMLVASVVSMPRLSDRPLVALPVVAVVVAAFLWVPGQVLLADGFANFWVACACASAGLLLAVAVRPERATAQVAAVGGLQVAVAWGWAPLVALSAPAVLVLFVPLRGVARRDTVRALAVLGVAGLLVLWAAVGLLHDVGVTSLVTATGGITGVNPLPTLLLVITGLVAMPLAPRFVKSRADQVFARRLQVTSLSVVAAVLLTACLLVAQEESMGTSGYYLIKFAMGAELVLAGVVPAACGWIWPSRRAQERKAAGRLLAGTFAVLLSAGLSQIFGPTFGVHAPLSDASRAGTASLHDRYSSARLTQGVLDAVRTSSPTKGFDEDYLAIGDEGASDAFYPDAWFHAVTTTSSTAVSARIDVIRMRLDNVEEAAPPVRKLLSDHPKLRIIVSPRHVQGLRSAVHDAELAGRIVSW